MAFRPAQSRSFFAAFNTQAARPLIFVVPFRDVPTLREAAFAHRGRHGGRAYHPAVPRLVDDAVSMTL